MWQLTDSNFDKLLAFDEWNQEYGWWRSGRCIYEGSADTNYKVNGNEMYGYSPDTEIYLTEFDTYTDWLSNVMNLTTEKNIAIFAESLAHDNGLTLSEFIAKYQK